MSRPIVSLLAVLSLAACDPQAVSLSRVFPSDEPAPAGPPDTDPEACWSQPDGAKQIAPVRTRVLVSPAQVDAAGIVTAPPVYRTDPAQQSDDASPSDWFETPCPATFTPEFIGSLQRALKARNYYRGPITQELDAQTQSAIRRIQKQAGLNSAVLSSQTARSLGLIVVPTQTDG